MIGPFAATGKREVMIKKIVVWICEQCGNYYGCTSAENLDKQLNRDAKGRVTFPRTRCPYCKIPRQKMELELEVK